MRATEVPEQVLLPEEVAEFRRDQDSGWMKWPNGKRYSDAACILATLEHLQRENARLEEDLRVWRQEMAQMDREYARQHRQTEAALLDGEAPG